MRLLLHDIVTLSCNTGAAFGIFGDVPGFTLVLSGIACAVIVCACLFVRMKRTLRLGLAVMAGGALSNFLERVVLGHVIDWIPCPFINLNFNIADVEISLGAMIVFLVLINENSPEKTSGEQ